MPEGSKLLARTLRRALRDPASVRQELIAGLLEGKEPANLELPESRASGRLGISLDATLLAREKHGRRWPARVTDVGLGGLGAELAGRPPEPGPVLVDMGLPILGERHLLPGRISWVEEATSCFLAYLPLSRRTCTSPNTMKGSSPNYATLRFT